MTWTQPVCSECWYSRDDARPAVALPLSAEDLPIERCCYCGGQTVSGIYVRIDPASVPYPSGGE